MIMTKTVVVMIASMRSVLSVVRLFCLTEGCVTVFSRDDVPVARPCWYKFM